MGISSMFTFLSHVVAEMLGFEPLKNLIGVRHFIYQGIVWSRRGQSINTFIFIQSLCLKSAPEPHNRQRISRQMKGARFH